MKSTCVCLSTMLAVLALGIAAPTAFRDDKREIAAALPPGWDEVQGVTSGSILKLARSDSRNQKARIAVILNPLSASNLEPGFDVWTLSDGDLRKVAEANHGPTESLSALNVGRSAIDGFHFVWSKTRRSILAGPSTWEFTYEGVRKADYVTARLTCVGNETWFADNQTVFAAFIRSLHLSAAPASIFETTGSSPHPATSRETGTTGGKIRLVQPGEPFWAAFGKSLGAQFVKLLGAVLLLSLIGGAWAKLRSK